MIADHEFRRIISWVVNCGFEGSDHLNVALEMTVVVREPLEVCVVICLIISTRDQGDFLLLFS